MLFHIHQLLALATFSLSFAFYRDSCFLNHLRANCSSNAFSPKYLGRYLLRTRTVTHIYSSDQNQKISCNTMLLSNLWNVFRFYQKCSSFHHPYPLFLPPFLPSFLLSFCLLYSRSNPRSHIRVGDCYSGFLSPRTVAHPFFNLSYTDSFEKYRLIICRKPLSLGLSDVPPWLDSAYT